MITIEDLLRWGDNPAINVKDAYKMALEEYEHLSEAYDEAIKQREAAIEMLVNLKDRIDSWHDDISLETGVDVLEEMDNTYFEIKQLLNDLNW